MPDIVLVSAAVLLDSEKRILLAQRQEDRIMPGMWELPGGKIEPGETPTMALIRELQEELGVQLVASALNLLTVVAHAYDRFDLLMAVFWCDDWQGQPKALEHKALDWVKAENLEEKPCLSADINVFKALRKLLNQT